MQVYYNCLGGDMCDFRKHYIEYLGINSDDFEEGARIFYKEIRNMAYPGYFFYNMIISSYKAQTVITIHPEFSKRFTSEELVSLLKLDREDILQYLRNKFNDLQKGAFVSRMYRYSVTSDELMRSIDKEAVLFTKQMKPFFYKRFEKAGKEIADYHWKESQILFEKKRSFICCSDVEYFSMSHITNIIDNGGNIAVGTNSRYRVRGYGKATVIKAVEWCFKNSVVPVYLVDSANEPSIKLAESLGMTRKADEIVVGSERFGY